MFGFDSFENQETDNIDSKNCFEQELKIRDLRTRRGTRASSSLQITAIGDFWS